MLLSSLACVRMQEEGAFRLDTLGAAREMSSNVGADEASEQSVSFDRQVTGGAAFESQNAACKQSKLQHKNFGDADTRRKRAHSVYDGI